jgi:alkanesulfonate monooxygenase SsuD/methylene tetrahydromethanopterin reductase-like flavin-dependent oxidoreductase (luciferase family)
MAPQATAGLLLPAGTGWEQALEWGRRAESAGAGLIWVDDGHGPVPLVSGLLRRLSLRVGLLVRPGRRAPAVLAKEVTSLDVLSDGRLDVAAYREAGAEEALDLVATLADGQFVSVPGSDPEAPPARCRPPSVQRPHPPLWYATPGWTGPPPGAPSGWLEAGLAGVTLEAR